jgi:hypothetical protein
VKVQHFYAFSTRPRNPWPIYERTFGSEAAADRWVEASPGDRFVTIGILPDKYWY